MKAFDRIRMIGNALSEIETLEIVAGGPVFDWAGGRKVSPVSACLRCALAWASDGSDPGSCSKCGQRAVVLLDPGGS